MNRYRTIATLFIVSMTAIAGNALAQSSAPAAAASAATATHRVGAAKLIIDNLKTNQTYYETYFGMKETKHYASDGVYDESIMSFAGSPGASLALFEPKAEKPLKKSQFPVALIYTPEFDAITKKLEDAKQPLRRLAASDTVKFKIAIARDPSGNAIEILSRPDKPWEVGGAKLIVSDRQKAEDFYVNAFGAKPGQRYQTKAYDEVLMQFGDGAFLALFQPLSEAPLPKSAYAVVAIYTPQFDAAQKYIDGQKLEFRKVKSSSPASRIIIAKDPAGNSIEIIAR